MQANQFSLVKIMQAKKQTKNNSWYDTNVRLVLVTFIIGSGGTDLSDFLAFTNVPTNRSFSTGSFHKIETLINPYLLNVIEKAMEKAREIKIQMTPQDKGFLYEKEWKYNRNDYE